MLSNHSEVTVATKCFSNLDTSEKLFFGNGSILLYISAHYDPHSCPAFLDPPCPSPKTQQWACHMSAFLWGTNSGADI